MLKSIVPLLLCAAAIGQRMPDLFEGCVRDTDDNACPGRCTLVSDVLGNQSLTKYANQILMMPALQPRTGYLNALLGMTRVAFQIHAHSLCHYYHGLVVIPLMTCLALFLESLPQMGRMKRSFEPSSPPPEVPAFTVSPTLLIVARLLCPSQMGCVRQGTLCTMAPLFSSMPGASP